MERDASRPDVRRAASRVVVVLGLYQGAVPLVVRGAFGGDQRFAPALWLPSPWWWIACAGIVALAVAAAAALEPDGPDGPDAAEAADRPDGPERPAQDQATPVAAYDALSAVVFLLGVYNGIAPFVARLVFDGDLLLAFTLRLPAPWWWIASLAVVAAAVALLEAIDRAKQRRLADDG
jgi:hypothetical protein